MPAAYPPRRLPFRRSGTPTAYQYIGWCLGCCRPHTEAEVVRDATAALNTPQAVTCKYSGRPVRPYITVATPPEQSGRDPSW